MLIREINCKAAIDDCYLTKYYRYASEGAHKSIPTDDTAPVHFTAWQPGMYDVFIGRQTIYGRALDVFGYELLFRAGNVDHAELKDSEQATSHVLIAAVLELGLNRVVGERRAFVNVSREFLLHDYVLTLDAKQFVFELMANQSIDDELIARLKALADKGYAIALDNYVLLNATRPLVEVAKFVKVNVHGLGAEELRTQYDMLRKYNVDLIAERVQTPEEFQRCDNLGFDYFQGNFLTHPNIVSGQRLPANRIAVMQLLSSLQSPDSSLTRIEEIISKDLFLSYRLLRYINSAYFNLPQKIDSIHRAVVTIGMGHVKSWASLIALSKIDDKPHELLMTALVRARMCESLARAANLPQPESFFIVGLFSVLDAIMDQPMDAVLDLLPLTSSIRDALVAKSGPMGAALSCALAYEYGVWEKVEFGKLDESQIVESYWEAIDWSSDLGAELSVA